MIEQDEFDKAAEGLLPTDRANPVDYRSVVAAALRAQHEADARYHDSYIKQADDTLALILKGYGVNHVHDECGVICKINEIEGLLERQHEASYQAGWTDALVAAVKSVNEAREVRTWIAALKPQEQPR